MREKDVTTKMKIKGTFHLFSKDNVSQYISSFVSIVQNLEPAANATECALVRISLYLLLNAVNNRNPMVRSPTLP